MCPLRVTLFVLVGFSLSAFIVQAESTAASFSSDKVRAVAFSVILILRWILFVITIAKTKTIVAIMTGHLQAITAFSVAKAFLQVDSSSLVFQLVHIFL